jgi:hypothetical protein
LIATFSNHEFDKGKQDAALLDAASTSQFNLGGVT